MTILRNLKRFCNDFEYLGANYIDIYYMSACVEAFPENWKETENEGGKNKIA